MDRAAPPDVAAALLTAGYRVVGPVGVGGDGPAWSAVALDGSAERVVVRVVDLTGDPRHAARLHRLRDVDHEHLVRLRDVLDLPDGRCALLTEHVPGATLAALHDARGPWSPGEAVTLAIPLADALAALHAAGLVHSDVSPANVVVRDDGRPVLVDLVSCVVGGSGTPGYGAPEVHDGHGCGPEGDVHALARTVLRHLAVPDAAVDAPWDGGTHVRDLLAEAADPDPVLRPTAQALADACFRAEEPEPVVLPDAAVLARTELSRLAGRGSRDATVRRASRRRTRRTVRTRRVLAGLAAAAVVAAVGAVALVVPRPWGEPTRADAPTSRPAGLATSRRAEVEAAARELTERRGEVLVAGDPADLDAVEVPGSAAHAADRQLLDRLAAEGLRLTGLSVVVTESAAVEEAGVPAAEPSGPGVPADGEAHVRVTSATSAHQRVRADGSVHAEVPAAPARTVVLVLRETPAGWRVAEVRDPEVSPAP
ncbi:protein kinase domain-containing protein [Cellulomonas sp. NS3]|uniref:protein kinase domain-containing protein n=1 Tax=Cellulomonas sp. NS3 TaxID=2973977 RepID=UPI002163D3D1|nr:protein kinase [Cellulomonas sp. NS3]